MIHLRASALPRVLACLGSVGLVAALAAAETPETDSAREGTAAHWVAEQMLAGAAATFTSGYAATAPNGVPIDADMIEHAKAYVEACAADAKYAWTETSVTFMATSTIQIGAKIDRAWIDDDGVLQLRDYKYGWRLVEAEGNVQLLAYAVGLLRKLVKDGFTFGETSRLELGIYQPRPYHPDGPSRTWSISLGELIALHDAMCATLAGLPSDVLTTGDHCDYCPAGIMDTCPAYRIAAGNAVDVAMRGGPAEPTPGGIGRELVQLKRAQDVLEQRMEWVKDIAKRALKADPASIPGWIVEPQRGNSAWTIDAAALKLLTNANVEQPAKLVTPAEAKRRGVPDDVIAANTTRPVIGEKLVRQDVDAFVRKKLTKPRKAKT